MSGFATDAKEKLKPANELFGNPVKELDLTPDFFQSKEEEDTCLQLEENPFKQPKLIKMTGKIKHNELKCMKTMAIDGLTENNSSITSLINHYRFTDKKGNERTLDLRSSIFEGNREEQLDAFKASREKQINKLIDTIAKKFPGNHTTGGRFNLPDVTKNTADGVKRAALSSIINTLNDILEANEERLVSKASYLNEYADFIVTLLLLGFHNTDIKIKNINDRIDFLMTMDPGKAGLSEVAKQQKEQQKFRDSCCDKIVELERKLNEIEKKSKNISDSKPSVSQPVVESNANDNKITILFQLINELSKEVETLDVKRDSNVRKMITQKFDKLKCFFRPSATSKTPEEQEKCNSSTKETLESMGIETFVIGGRKKKTRRKKLRKNKISLKRKHLKFKKIKGGKRFKITKKKRNRRSRKIYYKKH